MVMTLALSPRPEQAGRPVAALNGCSHQTGRHFWKATTWTSARTDRNLVTPVAAVCASGCAFSTKATATTVLVGVNYKFNLGKALY